VLGARRAFLLAAIVVAVAAASVTLRASAVSSFFEFLGVTPASTETNQNVQSYSHRTLLGYIGLRIWLDHPVTGAGWQESHEPAAFTKHLAAAHRRFPNEPDAAFPSPAHRWGVQNGIIQTLADLGVVGLALLALVVALALRVAVRAARSADDERAHSATVALAALIVAVAVFTGTGLLPGTSVEATLWLAVGLCASLAV
jgi:O-antigen ligase